MTVLSPGIDFLLRGAFAYLVPVVLGVFILGRVPSSQFGISIPTPYLVVLGLLALPSYIFAKVSLFELKTRREAKKLGARIIPRVTGKRPGNVDVLKKLVSYFEHGYPGDGVDEWMNVHGPIVDLHVLWEYSVVTACPEHIKAMLATDFTNFEKGKHFHANMHSVLGTGVFNSDGEMWKFHRSMTRPFFSRDRIAHFDLFDRHAEVVIKKMKERARQGLAIDFQDLMGRFTLDSATEFLFGSCVHSLRGNLPYPHNVRPPYASESPISSDPASEVAERFAHAFLEAQRIIAGRERIGWTWPLTEFWQDRTKAHMKVVNAFIEPIIKDAVGKKSSGEAKRGEQKEEVGEDETLLDHLVKFTSDPVVLKDETLNIMLAGRDTTAATLTIILYFLSTHPTVLKRLRTEVMEKIGSTRRPTYEDIREMKYLRAVINETLRLYPVVPFNVRTSIKATVWPSPDPKEKPLYIPAQTKMSYSVMLMQRRKDLWGPDAEEFDPDRFLDDRLKKYLISNSFAFLPFNAGPRICLGQQFAYNEMSFMLIKLLQSFDSFTLDEDAQPPETKPRPEWKEEGRTRKGMEKFYPKISLTLYAYGGLWVRMHEVSE